MRSTIAVCLLFAASTAAAQYKPKTPGWAEIKAVKTVLFPLRAKALPTLDAELAAAAQKLGQPVQPASLSPEDVMLAVGCNSYSVACLQQIGKMIKAPALILGKVRPAPGGVHISLRRFDVATGVDAGKAEATLPLVASARAALLNELLRQLYGIVAPKAGPKQPQKEPTAKARDAELLITTSEPYARVSLDGQPRGTAPLVLAGLPEGTYTVSARKRGFHGWRGQVNLKAGEVRKLRIMLVPKPAPPSKGFFASIQTQTWIVAGLGLTSLAVAIGFSADMVGQQNEFNKLTGETPSEVQRMESLRDTGERDAVVANVLYIVGAGLLATAGVLSYLDYRRSKKSRERATGAVKRKTAFRFHLAPNALRVEF